MSDSVFSTVNHYLFEEMRRLDALDPKDDALGGEIERARAIGAMAKVAIENAELAVNVTKVSAQVGTTPAKLMASAEGQGGRP